MKKFLFSIIFLSISISVLADEKEVKVEEIFNGSKERSLFQKPVVYVDAAACQLSIKFGSSDFYTVFVYDHSGTVIYQSDVISDRNNHMYALPELELGSYTVSIRGEKYTFEGDFTL